MALTTTTLINWINANTGASIVFAATPSTESLALLQLCLDAATASIESLCNLPETYPVDVELAILMHAARLWDRRRSPDGIAGASEFGVVRVSSFDSAVEALLEPYRRWSFG